MWNEQIVIWMEWNRNTDIKVSLNDSRSDHQKFVFTLIFSLKHTECFHAENMQ